MEFLDLKIAENRKTKEWYKKVYESYVPSSYTNFSDDIEERKAWYEIYNSDISYYQDLINSMCNDLVNMGATKRDMIPFNVWTNKIQILQSSLLQRMNDYKISLLTPKSVKKKNEELQKKINEAIQKDLELISQGLSEKEIEALRENASPEDLQFKNFLSEVEIYKNRMLKYVIKTQDFMEKVSGSFLDTVIQAGAFVYCGWKHGLPIVEEVNPLFCGFHKSNNISKVQKGDYFWSTKYTTVTEAMDELINKLSNKDLKELIGGTVNDSLSDPKHVNGIVYNKLLVYAQQELDYITRKGIDPSRIGLYQGDYNNNETNNYKVSRTHLEFKAYKKVIYLSFTDELGKKQTIVVNNNKSIIPEEASKQKYYDANQQEQNKFVWEENGISYEAKVLYIPRLYEVVSWANGKIFTDFREVPFQPTYTENPFTNFELSYKGGFVNARNAEPVSLLQNALPHIMQYLTVKNLQVEEISKYVGYERIQDIAQTIDEIGGEAYSGYDPVVKQEIISRKLRTRYFNSEQTNGGLKSPTRPAGITHSQIGNVNEILLLQNLSEMLNNNIGMALGVPPAREGQLIANTNVRDNQRSIQQTSMHTEVYVSWIQDLYRDVLNHTLKSWDTYFKNWFDQNSNENHYLLEYFTPDGTKELIQILPKYLTSEDIGVFVETTLDDTYRRIMLEKIAQNTFDPNTSGNTSMILKAITSNASNEEVHKMIEQEQSKIQKQQQLQMQQEQEIIEKQKQDQRELMKYQSDLRLAESVMKEQEKRITTLEAVAIEVNKFRLQNDVDNNAENDMIALQKQKDAAEKERLLIKEKGENERNAEKLKVDLQKLNKTSSK